MFKETDERDRKREALTLQYQKAKNESIAEVNVKHDKLDAERAQKDKLRLDQEKIEAERR